MTPERRHDRFRVSPGPGLGGRVSRAVALGAGFALLASGLILDAFVYVSLRATLVDDFTIQARITAESSSAAIVFRDTNAATQILAAMQVSPSVEHAELRDVDGGLVAQYTRAGSEQSPVGNTLALPVNGHRFADGRLHLSQAVREADQGVGSLRLVVTLDQFYLRMLSYIGITLVVSGLALGLGFMLVGRIRREINATERRLDYLAYYDPVTGLPNRHAANERVQRLIDTVGKSSDGFALLLIDLDDFKVVNDTLGHVAGDELLRALAGRLTAFMRPNDMAFRFGGDEFVILAPRVTGDVHLRQLGQAAMLAFQGALQVGTHELRARGSVGIAQFPRDAVNAETLVRAADTAMYEAKRQGKNTFALFNAEMHRGAARRMRLETDLRDAVARKELHLVYQPIMDFRTQRLCGAEALLRWDHPDLGMVSPVEFIPLAEASGLIVDVGQWVLQAACRQMKVWTDQGHERLFVAVNVSARQIMRGLQAQVNAALSETGLDPHCLEIEITEHSMVEDIDSNVEQLRTLRELGVQVAVDDFGTGLSSLAYLKRLPIGKLKIDRAFVKDLPGNEDDAAIASAIISMAHRLGLTVVAEGVETEAQRDFLAAQGCDCLQGYLYSRPLSVEAFDEMLAAQVELSRA
jgi:diguanylate cyclase (GGDEF)-like protein